MGNRVYVFDTAILHMTKTAMFDSEQYYHSQERMPNLCAEVVSMGHEGEAFESYTILPSGSMVSNTRSPGSVY